MLCERKQYKDEDFVFLMATVTENGQMYESIADKPVARAHTHHQYVTLHQAFIHSLIKRVFYAHA